MAQVLTRLRPSQSARCTASVSRSATRAQRVSSADDISCACNPQIAAATSSMAAAGAGSCR